MGPSLSSGEDQLWTTALRTAMSAGAGALLRRDPGPVDPLAWCPICGQLSSRPSRVSGSVELQQLLELWRGLCTPRSLRDTWQVRRACVLRRTLVLISGHVSILPSRSQPVGHGPPPPPQWCCCFHRRKYPSEGRPGGGTRCPLPESSGRVAPSLRLPALVPLVPFELRPMNPSLVLSEITDCIICKYICVFCM